jgi:DNA-binding NarL/FixJ family response regulator
VFRADPLASLRAAIDALARGEVICSPKATQALLSRVACLATERRSNDGLSKLTARERAILELIEAGMTNRQIATSLYIELQTVKNHVHAILAKLGVQRRGQAAARARAGSTTAGTSTRSR